MSNQANDPIITADGDTWRLIQKGAHRNGNIYCMLASTTRGSHQKNGWNPIQMCDWIDEDAVHAAEALV